jgi:hypothetical protein
MGDLEEMEAMVKEMMVVAVELLQAKIVMAKMEMTEMMVLMAVKQMAMEVMEVMDKNRLMAMAQQDKIQVVAVAVLQEIIIIKPIPGEQEEMVKSSYLISVRVVVPLFHIPPLSNNSLFQ